MSERSAAIGLASASSALPPPNSSACGFETNDQVTASTMPRVASARLALRVRSCIGVRTGLRAVSPRSNGVDGTRSTPTMRTISSTMSALPCTSGRHDGTAIFTTLPCPAIRKPSRVEHAAAFPGMAPRVPASRLISESGKSITQLRHLRIARDRDLGRRAAAEIEHHASSQAPGPVRGKPDRRRARSDSAHPN